ncbi:hypothetical protein NFX31_12835 [Microbacterium azadirachtae]|uniref:hypothetical protein n=1 Tax=Microbacterium azadirachtae TaxID=582680 RepID=UPI0021D519B8|nr:hypothetical protein [Microbacterium azadirachtae]UXW85095.1 hypothetical protein NFX31_12835 [Microbacterium azadirachtae]
MADYDNTVTADEWLVGQLALTARKLPADATDAEVVIETIDTLRTLREHVEAAALRDGFDLDSPVGVDRAARVLREAAPDLARTQFRVVTP